MADWINFEGAKAGEPVDCAMCEAMLPDAVDGLLTEAELQAFERHVAGCVACAREYEEAQRGAAWLGMLKSKAPEPPADLLAKILAETTGLVAQAPVAIFSHVPEGHGAPTVRGHKGSAWGGKFAAWGQKLSDAFSFDASRMGFQPRLAMTAAMAFFSVALTLNLMGVRLRDIKAANLTPDGLRHSVGDLSASATQKFQNLRVVYQFESRVSELRSDESPMGDREPAVAAPRTGDGAQAPQTAPAQNAAPQQQNQQDQKDQPQPKPLGHSELIVPGAPRGARGGMVARKEV